MIGRVELAHYRALRGLATRSFVGRSRSGAQQKHSCGSGGVSRSLRKSRGGDDQVLERPPTGHAAGLSRPVRNSPAPGSVQADQSGRIHESARAFTTRIRPDFISSRPTIRSRRIFISARRSKIRGPSSGTKESPDIFCSSRSRTICRTKSAGNMATTSWWKAGRSTARRCSCATVFIPHNSAVAGTSAATLALSRRAHRRGCESSHRQVDLRAGGQIFHGGRRTRSRSGGRRSRGRGFEPDAEDQLHRRQMADHAFARPLP